MTRSCWNNPLRLLPSLLLLSLSLISSGLGAEVPLRAFSASYDLHRGSMHIAISDMSMQQEGQLWYWRTKTVARSAYALLINNEPFSETTFIQAEDGIKIQHILITDPGDMETHETASFDWDKGVINVLRKGEQTQLPLVREIYDYHSINLLAASMHMHQTKKTRVDFYRKGKIARSKLTYRGTESIDINGEAVDVHVFKQVVIKSSSRLRYYYATDNSLLPLRVEKSKPGQPLVTLTLRKVDWHL